jgi:hypothetical protein
MLAHLLGGDAGRRFQASGLIDWHYCGTLSLKTEGTTLKGSQMADGNSVEIFDGAVNGVQVADPMPMILEFTGTVTGDEVTASVILGDFGTSSSLVRAANHASTI